MHLRFGVTTWCQRAWHDWQRNDLGQRSDSPANSANGAQWWFYGANRAADSTARKWTCRLDRLWNNAGFLDSFHPDVMLGAVPAMPTDKNTGVLTARVLAATDVPLSLKLALWAGVIGPLEQSCHWLPMKPSAEVSRPLPLALRQLTLNRGQNTILKI